MEFLKNLKSTDNSSKKSNLDERISRQKKTYTRWVNHVLLDCGSHRRVKELYDDLRSGVILSDIVYAFTGVKLKITTPLSTHDKAVMSSNLSLVLEAMRNDGVDLVNNNIVDIYDGKPKIVLGLIWQVILHYDIRRSIQHHQDLSSSDQDQSFSSYENGSVKSYKSSPTSKIKNVVMSPINTFKKRKEKKKRTIERGQCNKIILTWLEREISIPYGIKILNFSSDWKDGIAFMALIHKFCPSLVDMEIVKTSPPHINITQAFKYALEYLNIKNILEVDDILCESPEDSAITLYVSQFMRIDVPQTGEDAKFNEGMDEDVQTIEITSSPNDTTSSSGGDTSALVMEKVIIREENVNEEITTRQFLVSSGHLSTVSEESCEDMATDSYSIESNCKATRDIVYGDYDYPLECVREPTEDYSMISTATDDSVFEKSFISKNTKSGGGGSFMFSENNNLASPADVSESYDRGLENIFSSLFGDGVSHDEGNNSGVCDVNTATSYVKQLTSTIGLRIEIRDDTGASDTSQSSEDEDEYGGVIECCLDEMPRSRNRSFFDDSQESSSTSETIIQSITSINLDVVEVVEYLVDAVALSIDNKLISGTVKDTDSKKNVEEISNSNGGEEVVSGDRSPDVKELDMQEIGICHTKEEIIACENSGSEVPSPNGEENGKFNVMPWLIQPLEKIYEILNESGPAENTGGYSSSLKPRGIQDCDVEETLEIDSQQRPSDISILLNSTSLMESPLSSELDSMDIIEDVEDIQNGDDSVVEEIFHDVEHVKQLVENIASHVTMVSGGSTQYLELGRKVNKELVSLDFPEKTIEEQIKDLAEAVETLSATYNEELHDIGKPSVLEVHDGNISSYGVESFSDTEYHEFEFEDTAQFTSPLSVPVHQVYSGDDMNSNIITDELLNMDTNLRKRLVSSKEECSVSESSVTLEDDILDGMDEAVTGGGRRVQETGNIYVYLVFILFILMFAALAYYIYNCSRCSGDCHSTSSSLCCVSFGMRYHKLRGQVPF